MNEREFIDSILADYRSHSERARGNQMQSLRLLSTDLYEKDTHFIFELIQNAEDNTYPDGVAPFLGMRLGTVDDVGLALVIENNESGFTREQVDAICKIGQSTKASAKAAGFIGEKGIGFKSVFRITDSPIIHSNGFHFALPKQEPQTGLGYIVPIWQEKLPRFLKDGTTTIILPLDRAETVQLASEALRDIVLETLMFLHKLTAIELAIELPDQRHGLTIEKKKPRSSLVEIHVDVRDSAGSRQAVRSFWQASRSFPRPDHVPDEGRAGITEREVSVALPLAGAVDGNKLFAYLPVSGDTGLPFLINADFQLTSSREGVRHDLVWNQWLRSCIPQVFVEAFLSAMRDQEIDPGSKCRLYETIPLHAMLPFLEPVIPDIHRGLKETCSIRTWNSRVLRHPIETRLASRQVYDLLEMATGAPASLAETLSLVDPQLVAWTPQLEAIGVPHLMLDEFIRCIDDPGWLATQTDGWLIALFRYFSNRRIPDTSIFRTRALIPVEAGGGERVMSSQSLQPIYFRPDAATLEQLSHVPAWLSEWVPFRFVDARFEEKLSTEVDGIALRRWMSEVLDVWELNLGNYCADIGHKLVESHQNLTTSQLVDVTRFLAAHANQQFDWEGIPVVLTDGSRVPLAKRSRDRLVVPAGLDRETGWGNIWVTDADRAHVKALADDYVGMHETWFREVWLDSHPAFASTVYLEPGACRTPAERRLLAQCLTAGSGKTSRARVDSHRLPSSLQAAVSESTAGALVKMFSAWSILKAPWTSTEQSRHAHGLTARGTYLHRGEKYHFADGPVLEALRNLDWLPSTQGLVRPGRAFRDRRATRLLLGDLVPYVTAELPEPFLLAIGVNDELSLDGTLGFLERYRHGGGTDVELTRRLYEHLLHGWRLIKNSVVGIQDTLCESFNARGLILVPGHGEQGATWCEASNCIWRDPGPEFRDDVICLEVHYPALREFFVDVLGVKEEIDREFYAKLWLERQKKSPKDPEENKRFLNRAYLEIRAIANLPVEDRPSWWSAFHAEAKLLDQDGAFVNPRRGLVVADNAELRQIFDEVGPRLSSAWRPEEGSFSDWAPFFECFSVPLLSARVSESISGPFEPRILTSNRYITDAAITMIAAWIREERPDFYSEFLADSSFRDLMTVREAHLGTDTCVELTLDVTKPVRKARRPAQVFWSRKQNLLAYNPDTPPRDLRPRLAASLAKQLLGGQADSRLADWIELVVEEPDIRRIEARGWTVPPELSDRRAAPEPRIPESREMTIPAALSSDEQLEEGAEKPESTPKEPASPGKALVAVGELLNQAFQRSGSERVDEKIADLEYYGSTRVANPERRAEKVRDGFREAIESEPSPEERRKVTERALLEGPDPRVRRALLDWYQGKCQICGQTWPDRQGIPYFVAAHIVERQTARWLDHVANAMCLCADHFAQWRHASVSQTETFEAQVKSRSLSGQTREGAIELRLAGKDVQIRFCEKHWQELVLLLEIER
jgi:hypothetical protein